MSAPAAADARYRPGPAGLLAALRSVVFYIWIAGVTLVMGLCWLPVVALRPMAAHKLAIAWTGQLLGAARVILGLRVEFRGTPPTGDCIIAAKHQSFLDILAIAHAVPQCAFIMKRELLAVPVMGFYARKVGCIPIDRTRGAEALLQITDEIARAQERPEGLGQLIIYPEGTRIRPGEKVKYKHGVGAIYSQTGLDIVPVSVNCGLFWSRRGFPIRPGTAIVEFLPVIPSGLSHLAVMRRLPIVIETSSDRLIAEAGGIKAAEILGG